MRMSEKLNEDQIVSMINKAVQRGMAAFQLSEATAKEKSALISKVEQLEAAANKGMTHDDLKKLGMRFCPDGNCKKELWTEAEYDNLDECENCDHKIPDREKIKNCPNCGNSTAKKD